ncbi:MAG: hypothetical protein AMJ79_00865 [Phycisphaerae bacterium SM23_30]|nr:MAG: hypothetical protein AMJ79_00865 [Phycisphaerae bacterium SM23_30]
MQRIEKPKLVSDNILLRPLEVDDLANRVKWQNDPDINATLIVHEVFTLEKTRQWFEKAQEDATRLDLTIVSREEKRLIGFAGFRKINRHNRSACIYILIGEKEFWGKGIMYEAELSLMEYGFRTINLHKIWGDVLEHNIASYITMKKIGFQREGVLRDEYYKDGKYISVYRLSMLQEDFLKTYEDEY